MKKFVPLLLVLCLTLLFIEGCGRTLGTSSFNKNELCYLHNKERAKRDLVFLTQHETLELKAQKHAEWMADKDRLQHSKLELGQFSYMGENIAMGYPDLESVVEGWMNSSGHRRNILNERFGRVGFGFAVSDDGTPYWCVVFANLVVNLGTYFFWRKHGTSTQT